MISLHQISKEFPTAAGPFLALQGISLQFDASQLVALVGKSGSGKSTLLNMVGGIDRPSAGTVVVEGTELGALREGALARWRGAKVGFVFQFFQLLPTLTVLENVLLPMDFAGTLRPRERRERARSLLELVGVGGHADKLPSALSGGEQQRVAIARALANDPQVLLADEPTGNLDSKTADVVLTLLQRLSRAGKTVIVVTHDADISRLADRTIEIADGRVVRDTARAS